jgi:hypothetical protein
MKSVFLKANLIKNMKKALVLAVLSIFLPSSLKAATTITTVCDDAGRCRTSYSHTVQDQAASFAIGDRVLYQKLKGRIILAVQRNGEAYYVNPVDARVYYLGDRSSALRLLQSKGLGISNLNLEKIKVGIVGMRGRDSDLDGLSDKFEEAVGTSKRNFNTDNDVYSDYMEIIKGYNPVGRGSLPINQAYAARLWGRVLIQAQSNGEAWYVNPADGRRYFMGTQEDLYDIYKHLAVGISNQDFNRLIK